MKKTVLTVIRWVVGLLFIFSGLIKANDPLGLSYKMQEFFEAWGMQSFNDYTLTLSLIMNAFEVLAGVAIIVGWRIKLFTWLLLLLIIFFTFLTGYAVFSGKIKTCGCFGDCLPLTPVQSFLKDVVLLLLILVLFINRNKISSSLKGFVEPIILIITIILVSGFQSYVLANLPVIDCLPYKQGNNLIEQMKVPEGAVPDSFAITFKYKKNGKILEFDADHFPEDFDDSYEYVDRFDKLVRKGNATPAISDFNLETLSGNDTTQALFETPEYVLVFAQNFANWQKQVDEYNKLKSVCEQKNIPVFIVTSSPDAAKNIVDHAHILRCDNTVIRTAARVNPTYVLMQKANIIAKESYKNVDRLINKLK
jgi:uncharacterized membrane protein YphA (DoxX/SURF4 family)